MDSLVLQEIPATSDDVRPHRIPPLPTSVKINVEGAFIVNDESESDNEEADGKKNEHVHWERKDIRLPHHTDVVSHVAIDVRVATETQTRLLTDVTDWRLSIETGLLFSRNRFNRQWRPTYISQLRNRQN